ncbi:MAG: hypothetical protein JWM85_517 [Acidimicrobiaceae bacterium]|nr:hypothetical protein [Acidimicrobiaceae bacterium]
MVSLGSERATLEPLARDAAQPAKDAKPQNSYKTRQLIAERKPCSLDRTSAFRGAVRCRYEQPLVDPQLGQA